MKRKLPLLVCLAAGCSSVTDRSDEGAGPAGSGAPSGESSDGEDSGDRDETTAGDPDGGETGDSDGADDGTPDPDMGSGEGTSGQGDGDGDAGTGGPSGDGDGTSGGETSGFPDATGGESAQCDKIDILFVIDNTITMYEKQTKLVAAFPSFLEQLTLAMPSAAGSIHLGITKTDVFGMDDEPDVDPTNPCAYQLGGLVSRATEPEGMTGLGPDCEFYSGKPFMTTSSSLEEEFACAATVGIQGNPSERQVDSTLAALSPERGATGQCSAGFLRPDAPLVVVLLTDEDDDWSAEYGTAWPQALAQAKGGDPSQVAFLLISGGWPTWTNCDPLNSTDATTGADGSAKLTRWAEDMPFHSLGSVCASSYDEFLVRAVNETVLPVCEAFGS